MEGTTLRTGKRLLKLPDIGKRRILDEAIYQHVGTEHVSSESYESSVQSSAISPHINMFSLKKTIYNKSTVEHRAKQPSNHFWSNGW